MAPNDPDERPLPDPPRCRGIPIGDGHFTGCLFGYGDVPPFTEPVDCPICEGSGFEPIITTLPHQTFGDPECCGCLNGLIRGDHAEVVCNECGQVIRRLPAADLNQAFTEMELTLDVAAEICPFCRSVNLFPGFTEMKAYICQNCDKSVVVPN